ncbi:MAG: hypothetical protein WCI48_15885 [Bacteroidota bacterium]
MQSGRLKQLVCLLLISILCLSVSYGQEHKVNQKKINKERAKKQKQAEKDYHNGVKQHQKAQSKNTKAMMRQSRKESGSNTPVKR